MNILEKIKEECSKHFDCIVCPFDTNGYGNGCYFDSEVMPPIMWNIKEIEKRLSDEQN